MIEVRVSDDFMIDGLAILISQKFAGQGRRLLQIGDNGVQYSLRWFSQGQTYSGYFFEEELGPWQPPLSLAGFNANPTQTKDEVICHAK